MAYTHARIRGRLALVVDRLPGVVDRDTLPDLFRAVREVRKLDQEVTAAPFGPLRGKDADTRNDLRETRQAFARFYRAVSWLATASQKALRANAGARLLLPDSLRELKETLAGAVPGTNATSALLTWYHKEQAKKQSDAAEIDQEEERAT